MFYGFWNETDEDPEDAEDYWDEDDEIDDDYWDHDDYWSPVTPSHEGDTDVPTL